MNTVNPSFPVPGAEPDVPESPLTPEATHPGAAAAFLARVMKGAHETIDQLGERATPPLEHLEQTLAQSGEVLHDKAEQWRTTADEWAESLRGSVREHPLAALAAALAVGVVIARLTR